MRNNKIRQKLLIFWVFFITLIACSGPRVYYEQDTDWLATPEGTEIAHARVFVDSIPLSALDLPPVKVKVYLFLLNRTNSPLILRKDTLVLIDGKQNTLKPELIESGGAEGFTVLSGTRAHYVITYLIPQSLEPDPTSIGGFVFTWKMEYGGTIVNGRAQIVEDMGFNDFGNGDHW